MKFSKIFLGFICANSGEDFKAKMEEIENQFDKSGFDDNFGSSGKINFQQPLPDSEEGGELHMPFRLVLLKKINLIYEKSQILCRLVPTGTIFIFK